jgi:hypothetical protein
MLDEEESYKEYCITYNLTTPNGAKDAVHQHLSERGFRVETYEKGLDDHILSPPYEEPIKVVPMTRRLKSVA